MKKIVFLIVMFLLACMAVFAQRKVAESNIPRDLQEKIEYIRDENSDCTIEYIDEVERELSQYCSEDDYVFGITTDKKGELFYVRGDYDNALLCYKKSLAIFEAAKINAFWIYNNLGMIYNDRAQYDLSIKYYEQGIDLCKKDFGEENLYLPAFFNGLGDIYYEKNNYDEALKYYKLSYAMFENDKEIENDDVIITCANLGRIYYVTADYDNALIFFEKAFALNERIYGQDNDYTATLFGWIASIYEMQGDYDKAKIYYKKDILYSQQKKNEMHPDLATAYNNIAVFYYQIEDYDNALEYCKKALLIRQKTLGEWHPEIGTSYGNLSSIYFKKENYDEALEYCLKFYDTAKKNWGENHLDMAKAYSKISNFYLGMKDYDNAIFYYEKALEIQQKLLSKQHPSIANSYYNIGFSYAMKNNAFEGIEYYKKAFEIFNFSKDYATTLKILNKILFSHLPDPAFTRETLALATDTVERARLDLSSLKDDILRKSLPIYYYGVQFEAEEDNPAKAFEYSESMRSRGFLDQLGTEAALKLDGVTDDEREQIHSLEAEITYRRKIIEEENSKQISERDEKRLSETVRELSAAEKSLSKLDEKIAKRVPAYSQLRNPQPTIAKDAKKWCGKNRAVLEYVLWNPEFSTGKEDSEPEHRAYCIVVTKKKVLAIPLDSEYDYTQAVNKIRKGISGLKRESQFESPRNELYEKLIEPVLPYLGGIKDLVIVPDGSLAFLPFDVLRKDADAKDLGQKFAVSLSPSVSVSMISSASKTPIEKVLAFGGAWYDTSLSAEEHRRGFSDAGNSRGRGVNRGTIQTDFSVEGKNEKQIAYMRHDIARNGPGSYFAEKNLKWQDLPGTLAELNILKTSVFTDGRFSERVQDEASERKVKELSKDGTLGSFPVLHFACHGYFDGSISEMSSVLFSEVSGKIESDDDGYLTIPEASVLNLNADMVCLSACETGLGEVKAGDGMVGLSRAFMVAGARHVGVSLWCVDDQATAKFMARMYELVEKKKMSYTEAYRAVKAEFRKDEDFSHPYYWSAFVLYE